jgi:hypothetical protein
MHEPEGTGQLLQYVCACALPSHFVDERVDRKHDEKFQFAEKTNLIFDIHPPNQFAWQQFFYQTYVQQDSENHERTEKLQICVE